MRWISLRRRCPPDCSARSPSGVGEAFPGEFLGEDAGELVTPSRHAQADHHERADPEPCLPGFGAPRDAVADPAQRVVTAGCVGGPVPGAAVRPAEGGDAEDVQEERGEDAAAPADQGLGGVGHPGCDGEQHTGDQEVGEQAAADQRADDPQPDDRARPQHLQPPRAQRVREDTGRVEAQRGRDDPLFVEVELLDHPVAVAACPGRSPRTAAGRPHWRTGARAADRRASHPGAVAAGVRRQCSRGSPDTRTDVTTTRSDGASA